MLPNFYNTDLTRELLGFLEKDDPSGFYTKAQERLSQIGDMPRLARPVRDAPADAKRAAQKVALPIARNFSLGVIGDGDGVQDLYTGIVFLDFPLTPSKPEGVYLRARLLEVRPAQYAGVFVFPLADGGSGAILVLATTVPLQDATGLEHFIFSPIAC